MRLGINISVSRQNGGFGPASLFSAGQAGVWYDPSDITTLFQDSAGTTPVTSPGQPVGLMLDKSLGMAAGSNVASGPWINTFSTAFDTFSSSSSDGFTATTSTAKVGVRVGVPCTFVAGQPYTISFTLTATNASVTGVWFSNSALGGDQAIQNPAQVTSGVKYRAQGVVPAGSTHIMLVITTSGASSVSLSGLTVNSLPGNHATQSTAGSRPIYGIQPLGGRRNLAAVSSQPTASTGTSVTANAAAGPSGQMTAARVAKTDATTPRYVLINTDMTPQGSTVYTVSQYVKYDGYDTTVSLEYNGVPNFNVAFIAPFNVTASGVSSVTPTACTSAVTAVGNGWYRVSATFTSGAGPFTPATSPIILSRITGASGVTVLMTDSQLEISATPTAYQNVVSQYNVTQAGVQSVFYLQFDGVDDELTATTLNLSGVPYVAAVVGQRKERDTTIGTLLSHGGSTSTAGFWQIFAPRSDTNYGWRGFSSTPAAMDANVGTFPQPDLAVITGLFDPSAAVGVQITGRRNGVQVAQGVSALQLAPFVSTSFTLGKRGSGDLPYLGKVYGVIVVGAATSAGTLSSTESWMNSKTGAY